MRNIRFATLMAAAFAAGITSHAANRFVSNDGTWKMPDMDGTCYTSLSSALSSPNGHVIWIKSDYDCSVDTPVANDHGRTRYTLGGGITSLEIRGETGDWRTGPVLRGEYSDVEGKDGAGEGASRIFSKTASNSYGFRIIGIRLENGASEASGSGASGQVPNGGGVVRGCGAVGRLRLENCLLTGGAAGVGGAAYLCTLVNCVVSNNASYGSGGGCHSCVLSDCTVISNRVTYNSTYVSGGGIFGGSATNCMIVGNQTAGSCHGGGAGDAKLVKCTIRGNSTGRYGGGVDGCTTYNCVIEENIQRPNGAVGAGGGGSCNGTHFNSIFAGNTANNHGGGAYGGTYYNCTFVSNTNTLYKNNSAGGLTDGIYVNCISHGNVGKSDSVTVATNCCLQVSSVADGTKFVNCLNSDPRLDAQFYPHSNACKNSGVVFDWMTDQTDIRSKDLNGTPRIMGAAPDMGAFEVKPLGLTVLFN